MATLKITGVDEDTAKFVAGRSKELHFKGLAEYLRNLIREDRERAERERLAGIITSLHDHAEAEGYTDEQLAEVFRRAREEVVKARSSSGPHAKN